MMIVTLEIENVILSCWLFESYLSWLSPEIFVCNNVH